MRRALFAILASIFFLSPLPVALAQTAAHARLVPQTGIAAGPSSVECSPDCRLILVSYKSSVKLWTGDGKELRSFRANEADIKSAQFSPDGHRILTAGADGIARVWDVATGKDVLDINADNSCLNSAVFSRDGRYLLTGGYQGVAKIWDAASGKLVRAISQGCRSRSLPKLRRGI